MIEPRVTQRFLDCDEKRQRLFRRADAPGGLHRDRNPSIEIIVADRLDHHLVVAERRIERGLARARLDEIALADHAHREKRRRPDVVVGFEFTHLEDDLEGRLPARFDDRPDFVLHHAKLTREKRSAVDHHVDLVRPVGHRRLHLGETRLERCLSRRESRCHRRDTHRRVTAERFARVLHHRRIHTHRRHLRHTQLRIVRAQRLLTQ